MTERNRIEYHKQQLNFAKKVGDRAGQGRAYCNLGNAYQSLGQFQQAIEYHKQHPVSYTHLTLPTNREV